jgi:hypothetical protein
MRGTIYIPGAADTTEWAPGRHNRTLAWARSGRHSELESTCVDAFRRSAEQRPRLYRRQAGRARRAELEAALPSILDGASDHDWRLLTLEESDPLIQNVRNSWKERGNTDDTRWLPVERAEIEPTATRQAARLPHDERLLVFFHDADLVGLLELSAEAFGRVATRLIDLDGEIIGANTVSGGWRFGIDVHEEDDLEHFEIAAWDEEQEPQAAE